MKITKVQKSDPIAEAFDIYHKNKENYVIY